MLGAAFRIATVWGIPIRVHVTLVLILPFLAWHLGWVSACLLAVVLFGSVALHELGHSFVCLRTGCRVREILLLPIGGAARMESVPRRPRDELLMAIAGPAVSLVLGGVFLTAGFTLPVGHHSLLFGLGDRTINVLQEIGGMNIGLGVFNLLPAFPMDGGRVLRAALTPRFGRLRATRIATRVGRVGAVLFVLYALRDWQPRLMFFFIGAFIFWAAGMEYRMVRLQEHRRAQGWGGWPPAEEMPDDLDHVVIAPPPYRKGPSEEVPVQVVRRRPPPFDEPDGG
jgi:Zn-dependent protease